MENAPIWSDGGAGDLAADARAATSPRTCASWALAAPGSRACRAVEPRGERRGRRRDWNRRRAPPAATADFSWAACLCSTTTPSNGSGVNVRRRFIGRRSTRSNASSRKHPPACDGRARCGSLRRPKKSPTASVSSSPCKRTRSRSSATMARKGAGCSFRATPRSTPRRGARLAASATNRGASLFGATPAVSIEPSACALQAATCTRRVVIVAVDGKLERILPELSPRVRSARLANTRHRAAGDDSLAAAGLHVLGPRLLAAARRSPPRDRRVSRRRRRERVDHEHRNDRRRRKRDRAHAARQARRDGAGHSIGGPRQSRTPTADCRWPRK